MIEYKTGDLLKANEPIIAHGCNCEGKMGAGIAKQIRDTEGYPVFNPYAVACENKSFYPGIAQPCWTGRDPGSEHPQLVYNLGTQDKPGPHARLWWIKLAFANMFEHMKWNGFTRVAIPRIGVGHGGLPHWSHVEDTIFDAMRPTAAAHITVVVYTLE